ncbi:NAD(P)-dependent oxidoreductase [Aeromicrobium panaciterrae]|uniref:NAD(P)-dependent oxidoreductase n=1 Tax=Aeromicrobium panaciterrae TaxID=363861 RepID=UPI0031D05835
MGNIVVFGAGGRAGNPVVAEAVDRGHTVTAVVRDPSRFPDLAGPGVTVESGDISVATDVSRLVYGHDAVVHAVTPLKGPDQIHLLDPQFFVTTANNLIAAMTEHDVPRVVLVGHFSNILTDDGSPVADHPDKFPDFLRGFSQSHTAGLEAFRASPKEIDWVMLAPPGDLQAERPRTGRYQLGGETLAPQHQDVPGTLSYKDLAVAIVDEIETPRNHRARLSVFD